MMALQLLPILQIIVILCSPTFGYPVFGTKRYNGRALPVRRSNTYSWGVQPYQQFARAQRFPVNYYEMYPYGRDYQDEYYYPQEAISYPVYIPPPRTSKYEVYQAVLPYYYGERPASRQDFGYYGYEKNFDPVEDLEEEMLQEAEREEREDAQPIGQEVLYENEGATDENLDDVNAAFLQNLIMSQMYKDAANKQKDYYDQYASSDYDFDDDGYGKWEDLPADKYQEDEDVKELKQLAKPQKQRPTAEERLHSFGKDGSKFSKSSKLSSNQDNKYYWDNKRNALSANKKEEFSEHGNFGVNNLAFSDRKSTTNNSPSTSVPEITTNRPKVEVRKGQKEEVLMRPATPVKHPFSEPVMELMKEDPVRKREPSVYDTIKHMLDMEKSIENDYRLNEMRPPMRKRIISSEDSLTHQLTVLKKTQ